MKLNQLIKAIYYSSCIMLISQNSHAFFFSGTLNNPNQVRFVDFSLQSASNVSVETLSYAGGTSETGIKVSNGGFDTMLKIYDSNDNLIIANDDGRYYATDYNTGHAYDAYISYQLEAGDYIASLSQSDKASEFEERTMDWAVDLLWMDSASLRPEDKFLFFPKARADALETAIQNISYGSLKKQTSTLNYTLVNHFKLLRAKKSRQFSVKNASYSINSGLNAGEEVSDFAFWSNAAYSSLHNTQARQHDYRYKESDSSYLFGIDYIMNSDIVLGVALGYEHSKAKLENNSHLDKEGGVFALYGAYNLSSKTTLYSQIGYGNGNTDVTDKSFGLKTKGDFDSNKAFFNIGAIYSTYFKNDYLVTLDSAFTYGKDHLDSYSDNVGTQISLNTTYSALFSANVEIAKNTKIGEIYINAGLDTETKDQSNKGNEGDDTTGANIGGGVRFNVMDNLIGDIHISSDVARKHEYGAYSVSASIRYQY